MRLEVNKIAFSLILPLEEMVEPNLENLRRGCIARNMITTLAIRSVCTHHHCQRIPADGQGDPLLPLKIAETSRLLRDSGSGRCFQRVLLGP